MRIDEFIEYFLDIPVSINNLYGDPFFPTQIKSIYIVSESYYSSKYLRTSVSTTPD